jgi:hypothetical protein
VGTKFCPAVPPRSGFITSRRSPSAATRDEVMNPPLHSAQLRLRAKGSDLNKVSTLTTDASRPHPTAHSARGRGPGRAALLVALLAAAPATAQEPTPLDWPSQHRALAAHISDALVGINLTMDTIHSLRQTDKWKAIRCQAMRYGAILGSTVTTKKLVHRLRPDASDDESFFSGHAALSFGASEWKIEMGVPFAAGAAYGRMAANKHYLSDVFVGAAAGIGAMQLCEK